MGKEEIQEITMEQQLKEAMKGCKTFAELKQKDEVSYDMINARVLEARRAYVEVMDKLSEGLTYLNENYRDELVLLEFSFVASCTDQTYDHPPFIVAIGPPEKDKQLLEAIRKHIPN